jgi:hypothetical protein
LRRHSSGEAILFDHPGGQIIVDLDRSSRPSGMKSIDRLIEPVVSQRCQRDGSTRNPKEENGTLDEELQAKHFQGHASPDREMFPESSKFEVTVGEATRKRGGNPTNPNHHPDPRKIRTPPSRALNQLIDFPFWDE